MRWEKENAQTSKLKLSTLFLRRLVVARSPLLSSRSINFRSQGGGSKELFGCKYVSSLNTV
jgi:hypothetical protein